MPIATLLPLRGSLARRGRAAYAGRYPESAPQARQQNFQPSTLLDSAFTQQSPCSNGRLISTRIFLSLIVIF